jgi:hypothetical protein
MEDAHKIFTLINRCKDINKLKAVATSILYFYSMERIKKMPRGDATAIEISAHAAEHLDNVASLVSILE